MSDYFRHLLLRTPLEKPDLLLHDVAKLTALVRHPGLFNVQVERAALRAAMRRLITRSDATCIDVGSHIGSMVSLLLELAPAGQHMAFEPMPDKAKWLRKKFPFKAFCFIATPR
ncbi:MAG: hypothetical protein ACN4G0_07740 [Polyangiales bacterium]